MALDLILLDEEQSRMAVISAQRQARTHLLDTMRAQQQTYAALHGTQLQTILQDEKCCRTKIVKTESQARRRLLHYNSRSAEKSKGRQIYKIPEAS